MSWCKSQGSANDAESLHKSPPVRMELGRCNVQCAENVYLKVGEGKTSTHRKNHYYIPPERDKLVHSFYSVVSISLTSQNVCAFDEILQGQPGNKGRSIKPYFMRSPIVPRNGGKRNIMTVPLSDNINFYLHGGFLLFNLLWGINDLDGETLVVSSSLWADRESVSTDQGWKTSPTQMAPAHHLHTPNPSFRTTPRTTKSQTTWLPEDKKNDRFSRKWKKKCENGSDATSYL